jgi:hypothetical protein
MSESSTVRRVSETQVREAEEASRQAWELRSAAEAIWDGQQKARKLVVWADELKARHGRTCACKVCRAANHMASQARALLVGDE